MKTKDEIRAMTTAELEAYRLELADKDEELRNHRRLVKIAHESRLREESPPIIAGGGDATLQGQTVVIDAKEIIQAFSKGLK